MCKDHVVSVYLHSAMGKLKLCHKKNEKRKKYQVTSLIISIPVSLIFSRESILLHPPSHLSRHKHEVKSLIVSVPLSLITTTVNQQHPPLLPADPLTVSLPLTLYINLPQKSLSAIHTKLKKMPQLLSGWVDATSNPLELKVCRLQYTGPCPSVEFTITVQEDRTWQVHYKLLRIEPDIAAFQGIPTVLESVGNLCDLISAIDASRCCIGNPDEKFALLLSHQETGVFRDRSGKQMEMQMYTTSYVVIRY